MYFKFYIFKFFYRRINFVYLFLFQDCDEYLITFNYVKLLYKRDIKWFNRYSWMVRVFIADWQVSHIYYIAIQSNVFLHLSHVIWPYDILVYWVSSIDMVLHSQSKPALND